MVAEAMTSSWNVLYASMDLVSKYEPRIQYSDGGDMASPSWVVKLVILTVLAAATFEVTFANPPGMVFGDDPRAPVQINNELLCESCHAIFDVVDKKMGGKWTSEDALYSAMDGVCEQNNFRVYKMIPPTMKKGCEAFLDRYGEGIEEVMYKGGKESESKVCEKACEGVSWSKDDKPTGGPPPGAAPPKKDKKKKKKAKKSKEEL